MTSPGIAKDSQFALVKCYSTLRSIEKMVNGVDSPYVVPKKEVSIAHSFLYSDLSACQKHLKKALNLYQQEVSLARRYNTVRERVIGFESDVISAKNIQYSESIRLGKYGEAEKVLDEIFKMDIPQVVNHLEVILSDDGASALLLNKSPRQIKIVAISVNTPGGSYGGGFQGLIRPGDKVTIPMDGPVDGHADVFVTYFVNGKQYKRNFKVGI